MSNYKGRKPLPPERKRSEMVSVKVTPAQFKVFMRLGERFWLRKFLDTAIQKEGNDAIPQP